MQFSTVLNRITLLVNQLFHPGYGTNTYTRSLIWRIIRFISTHPLILFFVLVSFLFVGIRLLRRMIN